MENHSHSAVVRIGGIGLLLLQIFLASSATAHRVQHWITHPDAAAADAAQKPVSLQFCREVDLARVPPSLPVRVSADNRFVLYVNGHRAGAGPARGDLKHWRFEIIDIAPYLKSGANVIAAEVWNDARAAPLAQVTSGRTAFLLETANPNMANRFDTDARWSARVDTSRSVEAAMPALQKELGDVFYAAGPQETLDARVQIENWAEGTARALDWQAALPLSGEAANSWTLVEDRLPPMRYERVEAGQVVRTSGIARNDFPRHPLTVPPFTEASILIDTGRVFSAYPVLVLSGGRDAEVKATYVEGLYDREARSSSSPGSPSTRTRVSDRATVGDGIALGVTDTFIADGATNKRLKPLWWRTWRFVELKVKTEGQALTLDDFETFETGYPFVERGYFHSSDEELSEIWRTGWKTARIDAHETYMDSAYWEQLQYIGDTRIQMLLSYAVDGDRRLAVQALEAFDHSRLVEGLPQSAWPGVLKQVIPPFSLLWIGALHDYWMLQTDRSVLLHTLEGTRAVLDDFARHVEPSGLVGPMGGWPFVDWRPGLDGWAQRGKGVRSCIISMQLVGSLHEAADLEGAIGSSSRRADYSRLAEKVSQGIDSQCWDRERGLYADTPDKSHFSQHGAILAVLYDIAPATRQRELLEKVMVPGGGIDAPPGITSISYYFSFYLARALAHAGLADRYLDTLKPWRDMVHRHFTSWPETPDPSRSDTHAWSAFPTVGLATYVAGINSDAPGFSRVRIEPHLGSLTHLDAAVTAPSGLISAKYEMRGGHLSASIALPSGLTGSFLWRGQMMPLKSGSNQFALEAGTNP